MAACAYNFSTGGWLWENTVSLLENQPNSNSQFLIQLETLPQINKMENYRGRFCYGHLYIRVLCNAPYTHAHLHACTHTQGIEADLEIEPLTTHSCARGTRFSPQYRKVNCTQITS